MFTQEKTQAEAVIYYIQEMDIEMVDLILENDKLYQDMPKSDFIERLYGIVDILKYNKSDKLIGYEGFCDSNNCTNSCKNGYAFKANNSKHILNLIFEAENGIIQDIYECYEFKIFDKGLDIEDCNQLIIGFNDDENI